MKQAYELEDRLFGRALENPEGAERNAFLDGTAFHHSFRARLIQSLLVGALLLVFGVRSAWADTRYWTDAVGDHLWSTSGNWSPSIAPISGDILIFANPDHDNGKKGGFTILDIPNLNVQEILLSEDTESFTLESTVGPLYIYGQLGLYNASDDTGLFVECPLVIEDGGSISVQTLKNSTGINLDGPVQFTAGGSITAYGSRDSQLFQSGNHLNFNAGIVCSNDLYVFSEAVSADAHIKLSDLTVYGNVYCIATDSGITSPDQSTITFAGTNGNYIQGTLYLSAGVGMFNFSKPSDSRMATTIDVHVDPTFGRLTVPIQLDNPGNFAPLFVIEQGAQVNLSGANPVMGSLVLKHQSADSSPPVFNTGNTVPEFPFATAISVVQDSTHGTPLIKGNLRLDYCSIVVRGAVPSFLEIAGSVQGGFNKSGPGTLLLTGANNIGGDVYVHEGILQPSNAAALNNGSVHLEGGVLSGEYLNVANVPLYVDDPGSQVQAFTPWTWSGPVVLNYDLTVVAVDLNGTNAAINFSGPISGTGGLFLDNALFWNGSVELSGSDWNLFGGPLEVNCQLLLLNKPAGTPAFCGPLIAGGPGGAALGEVRWLNSEQGPIANLPDITIYSNCIINLNNFNQAAGPITFNGGQIRTGSGLLTLSDYVQVNPTGVTAIIDGHVNFFSSGLEFYVGAGGVDPDLLIRANINMTNPIGQLIVGGGILRLAGNNTFTANNVEVFNGTLEVGSSTALGNAGNLVNVDAGATLQVEPGVAIANSISTAGGLTVPAGQLVVMAGNITLQGPATINVAGSLLIDAAISGSGGLTKTGSGSLSLGGNTANTYTGDTQVSGGTLSLGKPNNVYAVPGNLIIGGAGFHSTPATVFDGGDSTIGGSITVNGGSLWHLDGHVHIFNTSNLLGQVPLTLQNGGSVETSTGALLLPGGDDVVVIPGNNGTSIIDGNLLLQPGPNNFIIGGRSFAAAGPECRITAKIGQTADLGGGTPAQLTKSSSGTLVLTGANNYAGNTVVSNGTLEIDGSQPQSLVQVFAATLQGNGTLGPLELDDPNAVVAPIGLPSTLVCSNFNEGATPNGTLQIYLAGNTPGTGYSQVQAGGSVNLANLNLNASLNFNSQYGDQFTIVKNNGGAPSTGAFNGLPEGSQFPISGEMFQITYVGGAGGDVVLTHLSPANQPNVATWINGSGGDWNNGANWNTGAVPNGGFAVVAVSAACVISNNANVLPAQMLLNSPLATITGSGNFAVSGVFEWEAGALNGSGSLTASGGLHLYSPTSSTLSLIGQSLVNSGSATWGADTPIILSGGAMLSNTASGTFDCAADGTIQNGSGTNLVVNYGLLRKIESIGTTTILTPFNNFGTVHVVSGTLDLAGGGTSTGQYEVNSGAALSFSAGLHTLSPVSAIFGAGEFHIFGGTVNLFGPVTTVGAHNFTGGIVNVGDNYDPGSSDVTIGACTVNFNGAKPITAASLTVGGYGSLGGSNIVTVNGPMVWSNSFSITGSNSLIANGRLAIASGGILLGRTLLNTSSALWSNSSVGGLTVGSGAIISNAPGATFDCIGNNFIQQTAGGGTVANAGLFRTIGPPATTTVQVPFNNSGTVEVQSGTLSLLGGGTSTGIINVFANSALALGGGFILVPGASITGPGQLLVTSPQTAANLAGTVNLSGSNVFSGGVANITGNYVCSSVALAIGPAIVNFNSGNVISPASLTLGGYGSLGGSNLVSVSGPMIWNSGFTISGSNSVIANGGLTIGPGSVTLDGRALVNMSSGVWTNSSAGTLLLLDGAILSNAPGATLDCIGNGTIEVSTGGGSVANAGLFETVGAPATNVIQAPFFNDALVQVQSGVLSLADGGSSISTSNSIAEIAVFSNATIDLHGGTFLLDSSAIIDGPGNLSVSGGTANLAGEVDLLGSHTFSGGTANLTGFYNCLSNALVISYGTANFNGSGVISPSTLTVGGYGSLGGSNLITVNGPMTWNSGFGITGSNSVAANGGLTIGPGNVSLSGRALVNAGPALWTNNSTGAILLYGGAVLSNAPGATFDCIGNGVIESSVGGGAVANNGLFRTHGPGAETTIETPFTNNGTVEVDSGALGIVGANYVQNGGSTFLNGGNVSNSTPLQILGGVLTGNGLISGSLTNAGLLHPGAPMGSMTVGGSYAQTAAGTLDITLTGPNPGTGFNRLVVGDTANLGGALAVNVTNSFQPAVGTQFQILSCASRSGVFSVLNIPVGISVNYSNNGVFLDVTGQVITPPVLQSLQASTGPLSTGQFGFAFQTASNQSYTIQEATNLPTTNWFFVTNFTGDGAVFQFFSSLSNSSQGFFRVRQP